MLNLKATLIVQGQFLTNGYKTTGVALTDLLSRFQQVELVTMYPRLLSSLQVFLNSLRQTRLNVITVPGEKTQDSGRFFFSRFILIYFYEIIYKSMPPSTPHTNLRPLVTTNYSYPLDRRCRPVSPPWLQCHRSWETEALALGLNVDPR